MVIAENRSAHFPVGRAVRLHDLSFNPYPIFRQLHTEEPVSWIEELHMWFIVRRDDNIDVLHDMETFTAASPDSLMEDTFCRTMISTDGSEQYRLRQPFSAPFLPKSVRATAAGLIETKANALIDTFADKGEVDLVKAFADPLALYTVTTVLGLPLRDFGEFRGWYDHIAASLANFTRDPVVRQRGKQAAAHFGSYVKSHLERLRAQRDDSVLSAVLHDSPHSLTDDEITAASMVIIFGGLETTAAMISNTTWALLNHADQFQRVLRDSDLLKAAIEEALRWESPVQTATRMATRDVTVRGVEIRQGDTVQCMLGAANRDPLYFLDPDVYDITRENADDHLAFAIGRHFCLGAALARLEGQIGLRVLYERLPNLRLHPDRPSAPRGHEFRSPSALHLVWG